MANNHTVLDIYSSNLAEPDRLAYPVDMQGLENTQRQLMSYKSANRFVGLIDGAYDVPTENHVWSLRDCRYMMARVHFGKRFDEASIIEKQRMIASPELVLITTVDADERVSDKKSYRSSKGNILRPVYPWAQRANRIAGFMIPDGNGGFCPVVDLITVDGDRGHKGTFLESHLELGRYLSENDILGTWLLYEWHEWFDKARAITDKYAIMDVMTRDNTSSTAIINKIRNAHKK